MNQTYDLGEFLKQVKIESSDLLTRDFGRRAFKYFDSQLKQTAEGGTLVLDSQDIKLIDSSFFDEAILNLFSDLLEGKLGNRFLFLDNASEDTLVNIEGAVARRKFRSAFPVRDRAGIWHFAGALEPNLQETVTTLYQKKELTARDLANRLDIEINNASNRLRRLFELHLSKRVQESSETGLFHRYLTLI